MVNTMQIYSNSYVPKKCFLSILQFSYMIVYVRNVRCYVKWVYHCLLQYHQQTCYIWLVWMWINGTSYQAWIPCHKIFYNHQTMLCSEMNKRWQKINQSCLPIVTYLAEETEYTPLINSSLLGLLCSFIQTSEVRSMAFNAGTFGLWL